MNPSNINRCFGCGKDNPIGLHLTHTYVGEKSHIEFEVKDEYTGYPGLLHGGITGLLLDEVMFHAIARLGIETVTLTMTVDYISPALVGHHLICEAWIEKRDGRKIDMDAAIHDGDTGKAVAKGKGKYLEVDLEKLLKG